MSTLILTLLAIALVTYVASSSIFVGHLFMPKVALARIGLRVFASGLVLHLIGKSLRFVELGAFPVNDALEALNFLALVLGVVFLVVARRYDVPVLGAFAAPIAAVTLAASLAFGQQTGVVPDALRSAWFPVHLGFAIAADALFLVAGAAAVAYMLQERMLRQKKLASTIFRKLPPLHVLDEVMHRLIVVGWAAMSIGILCGMVFAKQKWGAYWSWDPKQTWSFITWLLFAGILHARLIIGWQGRRAAALTVVSVVLVLLAFVFLGDATSTRHTGDYS
jgi:cytochrome c-type biogenesis protein CcsB